MTRSFFLPNQPTQFARSRVYNIKHTRLHIDVDYPNKSIKGKVQHSVEPIAKPLDTVELDSVDLEIASVKVNGKDSSFRCYEKKLVIPIGFELKLGEAAEISIEYSGHPKIGFYFRGPTEKSPNTKPHVFTHGESEDSRYYFPCYDAPNMRMTTETSLTVPSNWIVVSNGKLVENPKEESSGKRTWHYEQEIPHVTYLVSFVAGEYEKIEEMHDEILLEYVFPPGRASEARRSFEKTPKMIDFFGRITGAKYPYPKYSQSIVADFMAGGEENITATTLTDRTLHDERGHIDFTSDNLVSHELAHQWFGDWITCKDWSHTWINEGFATYCTALFREYDLGVDDFQYYMYDPVLHAVFEEHDRHQRPIVTNKYWDSDELFDRQSYDKASLVLNALRGMLGDDVFFAGFRNFVKKCQNSIVETGDFRRAMEEVSGQELVPFFQEWIYSPGLPEYAVSYSWNEQSKLAELKIEQTNAGQDGVPLFTTPFESRFTFDDGRRISKTAKMASKSESFAFSFESAPAFVGFDPKNWIPKKIKFSKPKEMLLRQLKTAEDTMEKVRACLELVHFPTDDVAGALGEALRNDRFWGVRIEAAEALGKIGSHKALDILLSNASSKDPKVRRGVAIGLKGFAALNEKNSAIDALIGFLENDESYYVRAFAALSLGSYRNNERAFDAMKKALGQDSVNDVVREKIFSGFKDMEDTRAVPLGIEELKQGKMMQGRVKAADFLAKVGRGKPDVLAALLEAGHDPNDYVKVGVAHALGEFGDRAGIPDLQKWLARETTGRVRRALRESIFNLQNGLGDKERLQKISDEIENVREELQKLKRSEAPA